MKAYADDKINVIQIINYVFNMVENIVGKGENAVISIFTFSHTVFNSFLLLGRQKSLLCGHWLTPLSLTLFQVMYFTTFIPLTVSAAVFVRSLMLPGASIGLYKFYYPEFSKLANPRVSTTSKTVLPDQLISVTA